MPRARGLLSAALATSGCPNPPRCAQHRSALLLTNCGQDCKSCEARTAMNIRRCGPHYVAASADSSRRSPEMAIRQFASSADTQILHCFAGLPFSAGAGLLSRPRHQEIFGRRPQCTCGACRGSPLRKIPCEGPARRFVVVDSAPVALLPVVQQIRKQAVRRFA